MNKIGEMLVVDGGTVKSEENGIVKGLAIVFGSPDEPDQSAERDFFTPETFIMRKTSFEVPLYHNHGYPLKEQIGEATLTKTAKGWEAIGHLDLNNPLAQKVYEEAKSTQYGFSTGALTHLVERESKENNTNFLKRWVVGELSLTKRPAERKAVVQAIKSIDGEIVYEDAFQEESKSVGGSTSLPIASRDATWSASAAKKRVKEWAGVTDKANAKYKKAFFWWDASNPDNLTSGKLPYADVVDGELKAIPRGIFAVAQRLDSTDIPDSDKSKIKDKVGSYYTKMKKEFNDDSIVVPWNKMLKEIAIYDKDGNKIWDTESEISELQEAQKAASRIELKDVDGSVQYTISSVADDYSSGTSISVYQWGGAQSLIAKLKEIIDAADQAIQADISEDQNEPADPLSAGTGLDDDEAKSLTKEEIKSFIKQVLEEGNVEPDNDELAEVRAQLSDSEKALQEANKRIAQLSILAGANETIDKYKGN